MNDFKVGDFAICRKIDKVGIVMKVNKDKEYCDVRFAEHGNDRPALFSELEPLDAKLDRVCEWDYADTTVRTECGSRLGVCEEAADAFEAQKIPKWHEFCGYCGGKVALRKKKMRIGAFEVPTPIRDGEGFVLNLGERSIKSTIYGLQEYSYEQGLVFATKEDAEKMLQALTVLVNDAWQEAEND